MTQLFMTTVEQALVANTATPMVAAGLINSYCRMFNKDAAATVYWTDDGTAPSATNGTPMAPGTGYEYPTEKQLPLKGLQFFSTGTPRVIVVYA